MKTKQLEHVVNEKNILFCTESPFLVHLHDYFQDRRNVYLIMDYMLGGELFHVLHKLPTRKFSSVQARFIAGEHV